MAEVFKHFGVQPIKLAIATDSSYVYSEQGNALCWRSNGWVTAQGPVTNVDLWIQLMELMDQALAQLG